MYILWIAYKLKSLKIKIIIFKFKNNKNVQWLSVYYYINVLKNIYLNIFNRLKGLLL